MAALLAPASALAVAPTLQGHEPLKHPIVLVHGATIHGSNLNIGPFDLGPYWRGIPEFLAASGTTVKVVELSTDESIEQRGMVLKNYLETEMKGQMVNLVAHSLGGLDARYMISVLHSMQVTSLTTIGTPHRGTPLADWAVSQMDGYGLWYWFFKLIGYDMASRKFLRELTTGSMRMFNDKVSDSLDVRYYSVATRARMNEGSMSLLLWFPNHWLQGQNHNLNASGSDGMVPFDSQLWGKTIDEKNELDHLGQMNHHEWRFVDQSADSLRLYMQVYENLEREGL